MLAVARFSPARILTDNYGTTPSSTPGTSVTPGANSTEGSWTTLVSAGSVTEDVSCINLSVIGGAVSSAAVNQLIDIGIDPAGGTSFTAIISDLVCGMSAGLAAVPGSRDWVFPIRIPAGSTVGCRVQDSRATPTAVRVCVRLYTAGSPHSLSGSFSETYGANTSTTRGTSFTPGNAAWGSWVQIGTTSQPVWWWQLGWGINNTTVTAEYTYIDLAVGDATNKTVIKRVFHQGTTNETVGDSLRTSMLWHESYCPVPSGVNVYVRGYCNNAPDTGYHANAVAVGGIS